MKADTPVRRATATTVRDANEERIIAVAARRLGKPAFRLSTRRVWLAAISALAVGVAARTLELGGRAGDPTTSPSAGVVLGASVTTARPIVSPAVAPGGSTLDGPTVKPGVAAVATPECSGVGVEPLELWAPDGRMEQVVVGTADGSAGGGVPLRITGVTQDEPVVGSSDNTTPDAVLRDSTSVELRAERDDGGDGRVYRIGVAGDDGRSGTCMGSVVVSVRRDPSGGPAVDSGARFDSTATVTSSAPP